MKIKTVGALIKQLQKYPSTTKIEISACEYGECEIKIIELNKKGDSIYRLGKIIDHYKHDTAAIISA